MSADIQSPRLRAIADLIAAGDDGVVELFWREMAVETTPLVERDPARPEACWVTFLWRATEPTERVVLIEGFTPGEFASKQMTRFAETDLWYRTYYLRSDARSEYCLSPNDSLVSNWEVTDWDERSASWRPDPLNPNRYSVEFVNADLTKRRLERSTFALPDAAPLPWFGARIGVPTGSVEKTRIASAILGNERDVWTYRPVGREPEGLLVHFDGEACQEPLQLPTLLDNLIDAGAIPPIAAVMIENVDRNTELPCYAPFAKFLAEEVAPFAYAELGAPRDPAKAVLAGQSYGGLAALFGALEQPETFGNALSQSGSFWWKPNPFAERATEILGDAPNYGTLLGDVARMPTRPVRVYMDAGTLENRIPEDGIISLLQSNRSMRDVLIAKGYDVTYQEFVGGHDYAWWRGTLADGLIALLGRR